MHHCALTQRVFISFLQKKYGLSDLTIHSLEDSEGILNAFEIKGILIIKINKFLEKKKRHDECAQAAISLQIFASVMKSKECCIPCAI